MESTGEEKKLQALFSELKATDEQTAPRFATVWNRAASKPRRAGVLKPAFVAVAAALVLCVAGLLFAWSYSPSPQQQVAEVETPKAGPAKRLLRQPAQRSQLRRNRSGHRRRVPRRDAVQRNLQQRAN